MILNNLKRIALFVILILFSFAAAAWEFKQGSFSTWFSGLKISEENSQIINSYFTEVNNLDLNGYADSLYGKYKNKMLSSLDKLQQDSLLQCAPITNIKFNPNPTSSDVESVHVFEDELIQIESTSCLPRMDLEKLVAKFYSDSFQLKYIDGLTASRSTENLNSVCQSTSVFGVGSSKYCSQYSFWRDQNRIIVFSANVLNDKKASAPVYLRWLTTVFQLQSDGTVLVYNLTQGRGPALPFHSLVKSIASKQQQKLMNGLIAEMNIN